MVLIAVVGRNIESKLQTIEADIMTEVERGRLGALNHCDDILVTVLLMKV